MGDSLSDKRHWANREMLWSEILVEQLENAYGGQGDVGQSGYRRNHAQSKRGLDPALASGNAQPGFGV